MKYNLDVAFLAGLFPKEMEQEIAENSIAYLQNAANLLQWNIANGLDENLECDIKIINSLYIGSFPKLYRKLVIPTKTFHHSKTANDINVGFFNFSEFKDLFRRKSLRPYLKQWAMDGKENKVIIAYALNTTFMSSLLYVKRCNPNIKTCIIVPDLPQYTNTKSKKSKLGTFVNNHRVKWMRRRIHFIDHYVFVTKQMNEKLNCKSFCILEGISTEIPNKAKGESETKTFLYSGTLQEKYGVMNLVKAFMQTDNDTYRLTICGSGECENEIREASKKDSRITFLGQVKHEKVIELQKKATVLVNPRQNNEEFTKYSFPSKNLEYLSSGTPLIAYKLDGIPDEYDQHIFYVEQDTIEALKNKLVEVIEKDNDELYQFGQEARRFVQDEKNAIVQTEKILQMIANPIQK